MTQPRIAPGNRNEAGLLAWLVANIAGLRARTKPLNLFLTLGKNRALFRPWLRFAGRLMPRGALRRRDTELVILRVAHLRSCAYEYEHHRWIGKRAGLTEEDLTRVQAGPKAAGWSARDEAVLGAVDQLHQTQDLDDAGWLTLRDHLDEAQAIEFCFLVGHYEMLATVIGTLRIQPDPPRSFRRG
jgi:AhpD family alkylhydroperoxidase